MYVEISEEHVPEGLQWTVPAQNTGQMVEVAYAHPGTWDAGEGDPWMRRTMEDRTVSYHRAVTEEEARVLRNAMTPRKFWEHWPRGSEDHETARVLRDRGWIRESQGPWTLTGAGRDLARNLDR